MTNQQDCDTTAQVSDNITVTMSPYVTSLKWKRLPGKGQYTVSHKKRATLF